MFVTNADADNFLPACCLSGARFLMTAVHLAGHLIRLERYLAEHLIHLKGHLAEQLAGHHIHLKGHLIHLKGHQPPTQLAHFAHLERHNVQRIPPPFANARVITDILALTVGSRQYCT